MENYFAKDYRQILIDELQSRCDKNQSYSLRSFARDLEISAPRLSDVLRGRYGLSRNAAVLISKKLNLNSVESEHFCNSVESLHARSQKMRVAASERIQQQSPQYSELALDSFKVVSDWYHFAILELTRVDGFQSDVSWIGRHLGISPHVVKNAIQRLKNLELLIETEKGEWVSGVDFYQSPDGVPSQSIRSFHRQILQKALLALEFQSLQERDFSCVTLALNKKDLPEAKKMIKDFRQRFNSRFSGKASTQEVYTLAIQFFRLQDKLISKENL